MQEAIKAGAAGVISGSATVKIIENNLADEKTILVELRGFVRGMKMSTHHDGEKYE